MANMCLVETDGVAVRVTPTPEIDKLHLQVEQYQKLKRLMQMLN
jgi:hypothetical protein